MERGVKPRSMDQSLRRDSSGFSKRRPLDRRLDWREAHLTSAKCGQITFCSTTLKVYFEVIGGEIGWRFARKERWRLLGHVRAIGEREIPGG
jgi:hypothetical protein